jgi:hypothetical protein
MEEYHKGRKKPGSQEAIFALAPLRDSCPASK